MNKMSVTRNFSSTSKVLQQISRKEASSPHLEKRHIVKSTRLPTGLLVVSLENNSPLSRISAIFKAGHRYESADNEGIVHRIRNSLGLPSANFSAIALSYETALYGGSMQCSSNRDFLTYDLQCSRDNALGALDSSLAELLCHPKFDFYHMESGNEAMQVDHAAIRNNYADYVVDQLHQTAFRRQGLGRSLFAPGRLLTSHNEQQMRDYFARHMTVANGALVALGVDHDLLLEYAVERFKLPTPSDQLQPPSTPDGQYFGGEIRKERGGSEAVVALAVQGVSLADPKSQAVQAILSNALGTGSRTSHNFGGESRLGKAIKNATSAPFSLSPINVSYTDSGLFGVLYASQAKDSGKIIKSIIGEFKRAASQGLQDAEFEAAKNRVKFEALAATEDGQYLINYLSFQAILKTDSFSFISPADFVKLVDSVNIADVNQHAKKVFGSKLSIAGVGNLQHTPYLDDFSKL